jgi:hypothetical protein
MNEHLPQSYQSRTASADYASNVSTCFDDAKIRAEMVRRELQHGKTLIM